MFNFLYKQLLKMDNQITDKSKILTEMVNSNDADCRYLAVSMVRNSDKFTEEHKNIIKKIPVTERVRNIQDIYKELNICETDALIYPNPKNSREKYINACSIIPLIVKVYNEGWESDWSNHKHYKYLPWFQKVGRGWSFSDAHCYISHSDGASGLHYKTSELCKDACLKFNEIYNDFYNG